jgi:hypothetical protein
VLTTLRDQREVRPVESRVFVALPSDDRRRNRLAGAFSAARCSRSLSSVLPVEPWFDLGGQRSRGDHVQYEREADPCRRQPIEAGASQTLGRCCQQPAVVVEQSMASDESELDELV